MGKERGNNRVIYTLSGGLLSCRFGHGSQKATIQDALRTYYWRTSRSGSFYSLQKFVPKAVPHGIIVVPGGERDC